MADTPTLVAAAKEAMIAAGADATQINSILDEDIFNGITASMPDNYKHMQDWLKGLHERSPNLVTRIFPAGNPKNDQGPSGVE